MQHEWIEVLNRRWCVCCTAFQQRQDAKDPWPRTRYPCPQNTPYANNKNAISIEPLADADGVRRVGCGQFCPDKSNDILSWIMASFGIVLLTFGVSGLWAWFWLAHP